MRGFKHTSQMALTQLKGVFVLAKGSREFFQDRISVETSRQQIIELLSSREDRFLELVRTRVYQRPNSPYLKLFTMAGCEFSDLRAHVNQHGLEDTLIHLAKEGVYLTSDEFKGKKEVVRGSLSFSVSPLDFRFASPSPGFITQSSGTSNAPQGSVRSLEWLGLRAYSACLFFSAHDLFSYSHAMYDAILPGSGGLNNLIIEAKFGLLVDRWFARKMPVHNRTERLFHYLCTHTMVVSGKWFGPGFPRPEITEINEIYRIVNWVSEQNALGKSCCIMPTSSNAVRIARVAEEMNVSLQGTKFVVHGEPFTKAKRAVLQRVGAVGTSRYSFGGGITVGWGCANPVHTDEIHVNKHLLAMVSHPLPFTELDTVIRPLLGTTLHPSAPSLLINVENGDYATMEKRSCGCDLGNVGFNLHLHRIRSFEKLTSEGSRFFYGDLFKFLEETMPSEFGGGPGDYQLVEEEDEQGQSRLTLVVHPRLGSLDEESLLLHLREGIAHGSRSNRIETEVWQDAGAFRIRRGVPYTSPRGKVLPLHKRI